ncbi:MAG TPA: NADPH-dependent glutamate synthase [Acidobacteriota bacterium]|jgi:glutamate synthase (NADPH/NADH) small chain|nr:NADPH-dependent glutamate synthase [Acidobacteriota bacterium]HNT16496.1 NADPH-dependent glutamate synthase [Acidobacteriota bacterium]HPA27955.1 NADPH-dependent glutamate synthase [Acidobacteriota bacterium]HQO21254.1 NADPH-dependent glutamate synthase [Acidobacteriota bacterium]HQQ47036.1 NADPH-dependent glutamate synthase [Acidobacteriota bacterium]
MTDKIDIVALGGVEPGKPKKARPKEPRREIACQDAKARIRNFSEVALGYKPEDAVYEAMRCLECPRPRCVVACPVHIDIPSFVGLISRGEFSEAAKDLRKYNTLPAVCGRVCPQENLCEAACVLNDTNPGNPVAVGRLERFAADWVLARENGTVRQAAVEPTTPFKVAVVGSGPSGLTCAAELAKLGHTVHLFEALHKPGGVMMYGIPEFRLPKAMVQKEINYVRSLGVVVETNCIVGKTFPIKEVMNEYDAIYVASGAGYPNMMRIPGENLGGIYSANEFLTRVNLMRAYDFPKAGTPVKKPKNGIVVGAGFTAFDVVRIMLRLGAEKAGIVYRRTRKEMPGRGEEIEHSEEEGAFIQELRNPVRFIGDERGFVKQIELQKMELGEPDASGRRKPVPVEGGNYIIDADLVVVAIGQSPNVLIPSSLPNLSTRWGSVINVNRESYMSTVPKVFAGGDAITGAATVILAIRAAKEAARAMDAYLHDPKRKWFPPEVSEKK